MKKIILTAILGIILVQGVLFAFSSNQDVQQYYTDIFAQKGIPVIKNSAMDIEIPSYTQPDPSQKNRDITYWISLLPTAYENENAYFIFPKAGTVIPVVEMTNTERQTVNNGGEVDYLHYLQQGALHHRGTNPSEGPGNFTIAGHTSYYKNDTGDFKTNMQGIFLADTGDTFLYVQKSKTTDTFQRYVYQVNKSYEVDTSDVSILLPSKVNAYELTVYGCSPIGTTKARRVVKASLISHDEVAVRDSLQGIHMAATTDTYPIANNVFLQYATHTNIFVLSALLSLPSTI